MKAIMRIMLNQKRLENKFIQAFKEAEKEEGIVIDITSQEVVKGMQEAFLSGMKDATEEGVTIYTHAVGMAIQVIVVGDVDKIINHNKKINKDEEMFIDILDTINISIEGSVQYEHDLWVALNTFKKI